MNKIRQQAPDLSGIRDDHVNRYKYAIETMLRMHPNARVLDVGCGVGYGSKMLSDAGFIVTAIDKSQEAIDYANEHYQDGSIDFKCSSLEDATFMVDYDFITMFEVIEHTEEAPIFLARAAYCCDFLFGSVPNENVVPFTPGKVNPEHYRHYTPEEIWDELIGAGWNNITMGSQPGKKGRLSEVQIGQRHNRTLVFMAEGRSA